MLSPVPMKRLLVSCLAVAAAFSLPAQGQDKPRSIYDIEIYSYPGSRPSKSVNPGIAGGSSSGFYIRMAEDIANLCSAYGRVDDPKNPRFRLNVVATQGGFDSVKRLRSESEVQLAIVQSDLWFFAKKLSNPDDPFGAQLSAGKRASWASMAESIRLVLPLYTEKIHIVVAPSRKGTSGNQYADLMDLFEKQARVSVGTQGSGSMITCTLLEQIITSELQRTDRESPRWIKRYLPASVALDRLVAKDVPPDDRIDAVILVGGVPYPALEKFGLRQAKEKGLFRQRTNQVVELALLPIGDEVDEMLDRHPEFEYVETSFKGGDYEFLTGDGTEIPTRGVTACLVTHKDYLPTASADSRHKIQWVRHVLFRVLSRLDQGSTTGLVEDFGPPNAEGRWKEVWENLERMKQAKLDWSSYGWERHDDQVLRQLLDTWSDGYQQLPAVEIIDPDQL